MTQDQGSSRRADPEALPPQPKPTPKTKRSLAPVAAWIIFDYQEPHIHIWTSRQAVIRIGTVAGYCHAERGGPTCGLRAAAASTPLSNACWTIPPRAWCCCPARLRVTRHLRLSFGIFPPETPVNYLEQSALTLRVPVASCCAWAAKRSGPRPTC